MATIFQVKFGQPQLQPQRLDWSLVAVECSDRKRCKVHGTLLRDAKFENQRREDTQNDGLVNFNSNLNTRQFLVSMLNFRGVQILHLVSCGSDNYSISKELITQI